MRSMKTNLVLAAAVAAAVATPSAFATNGYFAHGYSMKEQALAGAGVALSQDSLAAATNPAGMVGSGNRWDAGAAIFRPERSYTATGTAGVPNGAACGALCPFEIGPQTIESDNKMFLVPHFGFNQMIDANSSIGVSVYGNGGMNTEYKGGTAQHNNGLGTAVTTDGTFGGGDAGVDLSQLFIAPTYSMKIGSQHAVGVSVLLAYQKFKATGLSMFGGYSTDSGNLTDNGYDTSTGVGLKVGWQGEVGSGVKVGVSYQPEVNMSKFKKYQGLFANGGDFDIPETYSLGVSFKPTQTSAVTVDSQKIRYSKVPAVANPISNLVGSSDSCATGNTDRCLGGSEGAGFGWRDMTVTKIGYQFEAGTGWTWRVGLSDSTQPIPDSEVMFNILAPGVMERHYTFGFTKELSQTSELTFAGMYAPEKKVEGGNPIDPAQTIEIKMKQYQFGLSYGARF